MTLGRVSPQSEFTPVPSHGSIIVYDTTTKCHAGASNPGVSLPRFSYRGENFIPVRNLATVSRKREKDHPFRCEICLPVHRNWLRMRNVCEFEPHVYLINMKCTFK